MTVEGNGRVAPGNSVGTLTVSGAVDFGPGAIYAVEVAGNSADRLNVVGTPGTVTIDPLAVLEVSRFGTGPVDVVGAVIVEAENGIAAADPQTGFANLTINDGLAVTSQLIGNQIILTALGGTAPTLVAGGVEEGFTFQRALLNESRARLYKPDRHLWAKGLGEVVEQEGGGAVSGYDQSIAGAALGGDALVGEGLRLGVALGYTRGDLDADAGGGNDIDSYHLGGYGSYEIGATFVTFGLQGAYQEHDLTRRLVVGGTPQNGRADPGGTLLGGYVGIGHEIELDDNWTLRPQGEAAYLHQSVESYNDSQGLRVDDIETDTLRAGPKLAFRGLFEMAGLSISPRGHVGAEAQFALDEREVDVAQGALAAGSVDLEDGDDLRLTFGLGLEASFADGIQGTLELDGAAGNEQTRGSLFASVRINF